MIDLAKFTELVRRDQGLVVMALALRTVPLCLLWAGRPS